MAPKAKGVCSEPGCPQLRPCPTPGHEREPWSGSERSKRTGSGSSQQRDARLVMRRDRGVCHVCGRPGANVVDHVVPVAEGGADEPGNKAPIHSKPCHRDKTAAESSRARARRRAERPGGA